MMMLLSSFINDPIDDLFIEEKGSPKYHIDNINKKISWDEFSGPNIGNSTSKKDIAQMVAYLIGSAMDSENLKKMFGLELSSVIWLIRQIEAWHY